MGRIRNPLHVEIIPSPGTNNPDWASMEKKIEMVLPFADSVHIDLLDGKFAPNTTSLDPTPFAKYAKQIILEAHFMVENPEQYIESFAAAGFKRFIGQVEQMPDVVSFLAKAQLYGEAGLAIDGPTGLDKLPENLDDVDVVLAYTGEKAGFSGATMVFDRLEKTAELRAKDAFLPIEIDGGVNPETIIAARQAGVTRFVTTGYIYGGENPKERYNELLQLVKES